MKGNVRGCCPATKACSEVRTFAAQVGAGHERSWTERRGAGISRRSTLKRKEDKRGLGPGVVRERMVSGKGRKTREGESTLIAKTNFKKNQNNKGDK